MFIVFKTGRPAGNKKFQTYEQARQHARKLVRKNYPSWKMFEVNSDVTNPSINGWGYSVKRV